MEILEGLLYINDIDVYKEYGAFLAEKTKNGLVNFDALLSSAGTKEQIAVDIRERDGEKLPDELTVTFKPRDVTLYFAIEAVSRADFIRKRSAFREFLRKGYKGWLLFRLPEIETTFRFYLKDFPSGWEQLAYSDDGSLARFPVMFREPQPAF